jgi:putative YhdH/YhfP family quinone oxidoreductase
MILNEFKAFIVNEENGRFTRSVISKKIEHLPQGDVLINVKYSSLNYKDALSVSGNKGVTRKYPHTPGIDAAGIIAASSSKQFKEGDEVIVTGYDLGMNTSGGFAEYINVPSNWIVKLPESLSLKESMIYGTAGFTAALSRFKLETAGLISHGEIIVSGATGGVGTLAIMILAKGGYSIVAATRKKDKEEYLKSIGAKKILNTNEIDIETDKPLLPRKWAAAVDTVGGNILSSIIKSTDYGGSVASCGNASSFKMNLTVYPFILRGVNLLGINSAEAPMELRNYLWNKLSNEWKPEKLNLIYDEISLENLSNKVDDILNGKITGRVLINLSL